ncbi:hypothetical protein [Ralstonia pseudosolanacearum]|uniref:hypothetical protein n=1 Tax=Ralstonia pseudosolanacearum TaxID=1310165 RepID=UPI003CFB890B
MEYKVMWAVADEAATALASLTTVVNEQIQDGWEPQGGLCSVVGHTDGQQTVVQYAQAMIKR